MISPTRLSVNLEEPYDVGGSGLQFTCRVDLTSDVESILQFFDIEGYLQEEYDLAEYANHPLRNNLVR
jgi:hypothetical protein